MADPRHQPADLYGTDPAAADGVTPLLVVKPPRRSPWPWIWLAFLLTGLIVLAWLIYQVGRIYSLGQATLDPASFIRCPSAPIWPCFI